MNRNLKCVYPLSPENLQAIMDFYFPSLPPGNTRKLFEDYKRYNFDLDDIEYAAKQILPLADAIQKLLKTSLTQTDLLDYAIECIILFGDYYYDFPPERLELVKSIRIKAEIIHSYEKMTSRENRLLNQFCWN